VNRLRRALDRLCGGAGTVFWRVVEWPGKGDSWRAVGLRWAWVAACCAASVRMWQHAIGARVLIVTALAVASWRSGGAAPAAEADDDQEPEQETPEASPEQVRAYLLGLVQDLIGNRNGVHLEQLLAELVRRGTVPASYRITELRRDLIAAGIPVREQLKINGANRLGIHRDDLAAVGGGEAATTPPRLTLAEGSGRPAA
jgi:hypothetical protein